MKIYCFSLFALLFSFSAYAQTDTAFLKRSVRLLEKYVSAYPIEKVYLQTDKSSYDVVDTIWYKAYTVIGTDHRLSALSGVLYVELWGRNDSLVTRQKLPLRAGVAWGDIVIPDTLKPGSYCIRAYTRWMRNFGAAYFYRQQIRIGEAKAVPKKIVTTRLPDVQFFPEGGSLVNGLRSKVAVKAVSPGGLGCRVSGIIMDDKGVTVAEFSTQHLGMGVFAFTPESGRSYTAKITAGTRPPFTVALPHAQDEGFTLTINNSNPDSLLLKVATNTPFFQQHQHTLFYLLAQSGGKVCYAAKNLLSSEVFTDIIDKKRFPPGIVRFTLFSAAGLPVNERSVFIQNRDTLQMNISLLKKAMTTRGQMKIALLAKDTAGKPVAGTFSVAVTNQSILQSDASGNTIFSSLLLTSDLKGYVEDPAYYFENENDQTRAGLDALMLTQGYERYDWKTVLTDSLPKPEYQPESSLSLVGNVSFYSGKPVPDAKIILIAPKLDLIADTVADSTGHFWFNGLNLADSAKMTLTAKTIKGRDNVEIHIPKAEYPPFKYGYPETDAVLLADSTGSKPATKDSINHYRQLRTEYVNQKLHRLNEVTIKAHKVYKREEPDLSNSDNLNGPGRADQVIMAKDLKGCLHLADCLTGLVNGITIINGGGLDKDHIINNRYNSEMVIILDGAVQRDMHLEDIDPHIIHSIEVLRSSSYFGIYGGDAGGGALVITTKRAGDKDFFNTEPLPGTLKYTFKGFYLAHEFYSPKYDHPKTDTAGTDLRSTIYWNPSIVTDNGGKAAFDYFNADSKGVYRVVIEGIDGDGNLGRMVYRYEVK